MKLAKKAVLTLLLLVFSFSIVACNSDNELNVVDYCKNEVPYKLNESNTSADLYISDIISDSCELNNYSVIQINTNAAWTYGLKLEKISFDVVLSEKTNVDIDLTISNLENGENYNQTADTYYYHKTLSISKEATNVSLDISDTFINKDATFSFEIVSNCYKSNPNLKLAIRNFKMYGEHPVSNY